MENVKLKFNKEKFKAFLRPSVIIPVAVALAVIVATVVCLCIFTGKPDSISLSEDSKPQLTYVRGQELNLDGCNLTVVKGKKTSEIPLTSGDVTVSGYDKDALGEQTVTITYQKLTTEFTVKVVEQVVITGVTTDYLIGDKVDISKGSVTVTEYDGTFRTVLLSDSAVTVSGFDSSAAKNGADVSIIYIDGSQSYQGSYKVNIHPIDSVEFRKPNKITYTSHYEGKIDVAGAYFTVKGNGGTLAKMVPITEDMVSGFDVSAVNAANSPLTQSITVTFNGNTYSFDVKITYSDVSMFRDKADALSGINWNASAIPTISEAEGELALELMQAYVDMSSSLRALIDDNTAYTVARAAMLYGFEVWYDNIKEFDGAFAIENAQLILECESPDSVANAIELFKKQDSAIYTVAPLLIDIADIYGSRTVYGAYTFSSFPILSQEYVTLINSVFNHIIGIHDTLSVVPAEWTVSSLSAHNEQINAVVYNMLSATYYKSFPGIYGMVSAWRTNDDLFDILYNYLYSNSEFTDIIPGLYPIGLPGEVEDIYQHVSSALSYMNKVNDSEHFDTTNVFYNYHLALEIVERIKAKTGTVELYVYNNADVNVILGLSSSQTVHFDDMLEYIRISEGGIASLSAGLLDNPEFDAFMSAYVALIKNTLADTEYINTTAYATEVKALFDMFVALSPAEQFGVISTLNSYYYYGYPVLAFDDSEKNIENGLVSYLAIVFNNFMRSKLSEAKAEVYDNLIFAIEIYSNFYANRQVEADYETWKNAFISAIDTVTADIINLDTADADAFELYLGDAYDKYLAIRNNLDATADLGAWADEFTALGDALHDVQTALGVLKSYPTAYSYFLASFERAAAIADTIKTAPDAIKYAFYHEALFDIVPADAEKGTAATYATYDFALTAYRDYYVTLLISYGENQINLYDTYKERNMSVFLSAYYDMISPFMHKNGDTVNFDKALVLGVIDAFSKLDSTAKSFFMVLEGDLELYYGALDKFIKDTFTAAAGEVANKLFALEQAYYTYELNNDGVALNTVKALLTELTNLYGALSDKSELADLQSIYDYYVDKCAALTTAV